MTIELGVFIVLGNAQHGVLIILRDQDKLTDLLVDIDGKKLDPMGIRGRLFRPLVAKVKHLGGLRLQGVVADRGLLELRHDLAPWLLAEWACLINRVA
jgi:hypothetical protein